MATRYATRLNSFASAPQLCWGENHGKPSPKDLILRASQVEGLTDIDLNYPDHIESQKDQIRSALDETGIVLSGLAMRYYSLPEFRAGAFTNPDSSVRRAAIDLTKRGIDACRELGTNLMTIWPGQDGFESNFQLDYAVAWNYMVEGLIEVADHDPDCDISIEYKPDDPRGFSMLPDAATTLLMLKDVNRANTGVTIDFAHSLYASEQPAYAASLIHRNSRLLGLHLNDGFGKRDDGLMVAAVHPHATLELMLEMRRNGFDGPIYFDTFPDTAQLDPVAECALNIKTCERLLAACAQLEQENRLSGALLQQDAVSGMGIVNSALFGLSANHG
nr:sugar phosphate isomerase/epimerase family protein [uncultured Cohaesibacter sp.]